MQTDSSPFCSPRFGEVNQGCIRFCTHHFPLYSITYLTMAGGRYPYPKHVWYVASASTILYKDSVYQTTQPSRRRLYCRLWRINPRSSAPNISHVEQPTRDIRSQNREEKKRRWRSEKAHDPRYCSYCPPTSRSLSTNRSLHGTRTERRQSGR